MGDDAAFVFAGQTGLSYGGAYDVLYGSNLSSTRYKVECPICSKRFKTHNGALKHARQIHWRDIYQQRISDFEKNLPSI